MGNKREEGKKKEKEKVEKKEEEIVYSWMDDPKETWIENPWGEIMCISARFLLSAEESSFHYRFLRIGFSSKASFWNETNVEYLCLFLHKKYIYTAIIDRHSIHQFIKEYIHLLPSMKKFRIICVCVCILLSFPFGLRPAFIVEEKEKTHGVKIRLAVTLAGSFDSPRPTLYFLMAVHDDDLSRRLRLFPFSAYNFISSHRYPE